MDSNAVWSLSKTLKHCAQSIEFSMTGFPEPTSAMFQNMVEDATPFSQKRTKQNGLRTGVYHAFDTAPVGVQT
ncbi:DUF1569 domain-containing protein [Rhodoferax potami]|uniref:DUF1569 domain-containing protein n=1 Tax=Rhodoferax potami TaxID=3068338 RepID=UPI003D32667A